MRYEEFLEALARVAFYIDIQPIGPTEVFNITGITVYYASGLDLRTSGNPILYLINTTSQVMTITNNSSSSSAINRILTGTGSDLVANHVTLMWDNQTTMWRVVGHS